MILVAILAPNLQVIFILISVFPFLQPWRYGCEGLYFEMFIWFCLLIFNYFRHFMKIFSGKLEELVMSHMDGFFGLLDSCLHFIFSVAVASVCYTRYWFHFFCTFGAIVQLLSRVRLSVTPWTTARQASLSSSLSHVCSHSRASSRWCHPSISSTVVPFFSCAQSAWGSFPMST